MIRLSTFYGVLAAASLLAGCASTGADVLGRSSLTNDGHPSGWALEVRQTAVDAYLYSQLALDAYQRGNAMALPAHVRLDSVVTGRVPGFSAAVYSVARGDGRPAERVIAFRGTEGKVWELDWIHGNLLAKQNGDGTELFDRVRTAVPAGTPVTLTGHSLGGAIALHVSLRREGAPVYVFDPSSRFTRGPAPQRNCRVAVSHGYEINKVLRLLAVDPAGTYTSLSCDRSFRLFANHSMRRLAECLTQVAATEDDGALASLTLNGLTPRYPRRPAGR